jgi:hypothetical protein
VANSKVTNKGQDKHQFIDKDELIGESILDISDYFKDDKKLSYSDYYDDSIPYEVKPVPYLKPMEEQDYPTQTKDLFAGLFQETPKSQLQMSPLMMKETDDVTYNDENYNWATAGIAVFIQYKNLYVASVFGGEDLDIGFYSNNNEVEFALNDRIGDSDINIADINTHQDLENTLYDFAFPFNRDEFLKGRIFEIKDEEYKYIFGFWEDITDIRRHAKSIFSFLKRLHIDPQKILWTYEDGYKVLTFKKMFGIKKKKPSRSKEQIELLKRIHLDATLKKKVLQLPPHPFQLLADKLGMTVAGLRQLAGMAIAEEASPQNKEILLEAMERGDGFWLSPKGVFHNVDIELGANGHLDWAKRKFKKVMSYEEVLELGYVWVGVMEDTNSINFLYHEQPSDVQMYLLKKTAEDENLSLYDMKKKEAIDTSLLKETETIKYKGKEYSFETDAVSTMVMYDWEKQPSAQIEEGTKNLETLPKLFYVASLDTKYFSDWKELDAALRDLNQSADTDETHSEIRMMTYRALPHVKKEYDKSKKEFPNMKGILEARVFKDDAFPGGYVIGFWESRRVVQKYHEKIVEYLSDIGIENYKNILWTAAGGELIQAYNEFFGKLESKEDLQKIALLKLVHLNAIAKKMILDKPVHQLQSLADSMGITFTQLRQILGSMDESILKESDNVIIQGKFYNYNKNASSVVVIYSSNTWVASVFKEPFDLGYMSNNNDLQADLIKYHKDNRYSDFDNSFDYPYNHPDLKDYIEKIGFFRLGEPDIEGRLFDTNRSENRYVLSFWEYQEEIIQHKNQIFDYLKRLGLNPKDVLWGWNGGHNQIKSYEEFFGDQQKDSLTPEQRALMKVQHLDALAKRKLLQLPPTKFEGLADSMGITTVQLHQKLGSLDENTDYSINAILIWLEKDGTIYNTDDTQHGIYVADNPDMFGVSNDFTQKVFKKFGKDYDGAADIMCEQAFKKKWMRVVKIPWRNKIMVEGQEPTKEQRRVLENWFFEDKSKTIIWQQWVSSKFGPPHPVILFSSETTNEGVMNEVEGARDASGDVRGWKIATGIFTLFNNSFWVVQHYISRTNKVEYECSDKEIEKELNRNPKYQNDSSGGRDDDYARTHYSIHDHIQDAVKQLSKSEKTKEFRNYHGEVSGRVFQFKNKNVIGFWQGIDEIRANWRMVEMLIKKFNVDPKTAFYNFDNYYHSKEDEYAYTDIAVSLKIGREVDPYEKELMKIQHLSPEAKKALLQLPSNRLQTVADKLSMTVIELRRLLGRDIAEQINETPDYIKVNQPSGPPYVTGYDENEVVAVCCCGWVYGERGWVCWERKTGDIVSNDHNSVEDIHRGGHLTHGDVLSYFFGDEYESEYDDRGEKTSPEYERGIHYRLYKVRNIYYLTAWEKKSIINAWKKEIISSLKALGVDEKKVMYQYGMLGNNEFDDYYTTFDETKPVTGTGSEEEYKRAEQLHLLPPEKKKAMLQAMGAANMDKQQAAADKIGMTVVQLRQALGRTDESITNNQMLIGDCRNEDLVNDIFGSVSEFNRQVDANGDNFQYENIEVKYDKDNDIHYFYQS